MAERFGTPPGITQGDIGARYTRKRLSDEVYIGHYIKAGDRIRVRSTILTGVIASLTTVNLTIGGRVQGMDGDLVPFGDSFTLTADGVQTAQYVMAPEGYVVDLIVQSTSTGLTSGDLTVIVDIVQGTGSNAVAVGLLAYGYVYPAGLLGLNVSRNIGGGSGGGMAIGGTVTSGTAGSVLFVGTGPVLAEEPTNLKWDTTNKTLTIGAAADGAGKQLLAVGPSSTHLGDGVVEFVGHNDFQVKSFAVGIEATESVAAASTLGALEVQSDTRNATGAMSFNRAVDVQAYHSGNGTLTEAVGVWIHNIGSLGSGAVNNAQGLLVSNFSTGGGLTEASGVQVGDVTGATTNYAIKTGLGTVSLGDVLLLPSVAIAALPATPATGMVMAVTDSLVPVIGSTVASGGSAKALVWYNGANWTVIGK